MLRSYTLGLILATLAITATATSKRYVPDSSGVPIEEAQRVLHFPGHRNWETSDGVLLVCEYYYKSSFTEKTCTDKKGVDRWKPVNDLKLTGFEISYIGVQFIGPTGSRQVIVYFRKTPK
jgi:hypothetical protein